MSGWHWIATVASIAAIVLGTVLIVLALRGDDRK